MRRPDLRPGHSATSPDQVTVRPSTTNRLPAWSLFAALIAVAGLPVHIHAPRFYVDSYSTSLAAMGLTLAALRLIDVFEDPLPGWLAEATRPHSRAGIALEPALMAAPLTALFAVPPPFTTFDLWSFVSRLSHALAALIILPAFDAAGFQPCRTNPDSELSTLTLIQAGLPCVLKVTTIALLALTRLPDPSKDPAP